MLVAGIVLVMVVLFALFRDEFPWPTSLTWVELPVRLDDLQDWLLEQRTAENPNLIFAIFDGFRALAEWMVTALNDALLWLTWPGVIAASTLIVLRFGGWRAALIVFASFVSFALMGLWEESIQTLALMSAAVLLSLAIGVPIGLFAGRNDRILRAHHPGARRHADRARLRLPDAGGDPLLGRPGGGRDLHDDLRDPAGRAHHRARHPRRHARIGRGLAGAGRHAARRRCSRCSCRWPASRSCSRSTRRSCSRSRWW